jgi:hypothetical protein
MSDTIERGVVGIRRDAEPVKSLSRLDSAVLDMSHASPAIDDLVGWLHNEVFTTSREWASDSYNQDLFLESRGRIVHVNETRGDWTIGIGLRGMQTTFRADIWAVWMGQLDPANQLSDLEQVDFIKHKWDAAVALATGDSSVEAQLAAIDRDFVARRFRFRRHDASG